MEDLDLEIPQTQEEEINTPEPPQEDVDLDASSIIQEDTPEILPVTRLQTGATELSPDLARVRDYMVNSHKQSYLRNQGSFQVDLHTPTIQEEGFSFSIYSPDVSIDNFYKTFKDGEMVPLYPEYKIGYDNAEIAARNQTTGQKFKHGMLKAGATFGTTLLGGTIGMLTGAVNFISNGFELEAMRTDDFSTFLDDLNEKLQYKLPNHLTRREQDYNFFQKLPTANFLFDELPNGLAFVAGAIASEAVWRTVTGGMGTTMARHAFRSSKFLRAAENVASQRQVGSRLTRILSRGERDLARAGKRVSRATEQSIKAGRLGELIHTGRFIWTNGAYQGGVETRQMMKEATEEFENFYLEKGTSPTEEERRRFEERLRQYSNGLFLANTALVGASGFITIGKVFNMRNPLIRSGKSSLGKTIDERIFGLGIKPGGKLIEPKKWQKIAGTSYRFARQPVYTGAIEIALQRAGREGGKAWLESAYDQEATENTLSLMEAFYKGAQEAWGTKEGWNEIGIGVLMGVMTGTLSGDLTAYSRERKALEAYSKNRNFSTENVAEKMKTMNQIYNATKKENAAKERGDFVAEQQARESAMLSVIALHEDFGYGQEAMADFNHSIDLIDAEKLAREQGVEVEVIESYKEAVKEEYRDARERYNRNKEFADYMVGSGKAFENIKNKREAAKAIAYNLTVGENSYKMANDILSEIRSSLKNVTTDGRYDRAMAIRHKMASAEEAKSSELEGLIREKQELKRQEEDLVRDIQRKQTEILRADPETKVTQAEELNRLNIELAEIDSQINRITAEQEALWSAIEAENRFDSTEELNVTAEELDAIATYDSRGKITGGLLANIDKYMESISESNPREYQKMSRLFDEYHRVMNDYKAFTETVKGLGSEQFDPGNSMSWVDRLFRNKDSNEFTADFFANVIENYTQELGKRVVEYDQKMSERQREESLNDLEQNEITETKPENVDIKVTEFAKERLDNPNRKLTSEEMTFMQENAQQIANETQRIQNIQEKYNRKRARITKPDMYTEGIVGNTLYQIEADGTVRYNDKKIDTRGKDPKTAIREHIESRKNKELKERDDTLREEDITESTKVVNKKTGQEAEIRVDSEGKVTEHIKAKDGEIVNSITKEEAVKKYNKDSSLQEQAIESKYQRELQEVDRYNQVNLEADEVTSYRQNIKNQIKELLEKVPGVHKYLGSDTAEVEGNRVSVDEYAEYGALLDVIGLEASEVIDSENYQQFKENSPESKILEKEFNRFKDLNDKLSKWYIAEGVVSETGAYTLADLIERLHHLNESRQQVDTQTEVTQEGAVEITRAGDVETGGKGKTFMFIQTPVGIYLSFPENTNAVRVHHMYPETFLEKIGNKAPGQTLRKNRRGLYKVELEDGSHVLFRVDDGKRYIEIHRGMWEKIEDSFGVQFMKSNLSPHAEPYVLGYDTSTMEVATADFNDNQTSNPFKYELMTNEEMARLREVELVVDPQNTYNQQILREAEEIRKREGDAEADSYIAKRVVIHTVSGNKTAGNLRADYNEGGRQGYENFKMIRVLAAEVLKTARPDSPNIKLGPKIKTQFKYKGVPIFNMAMNEQGRMAVQNIEVTEEAAQQIQATGYVEGGEVKLNRKLKRLNKDYLPKGKGRVPVIAFKYGSEHIVFPVTLKPGINENLGNQMEAFINEKGTNPVNSAIEFLRMNNLPLEIIENMNITDQNINELFGELKERINEMEVMPDTDVWATEGLNTSQIMDQMLTPINLENLSSNKDVQGEVFNSPKMALTLTSVNEQQFDLSNIANRVYEDTSFIKATELLGQTREAFSEEGVAEALRATKDKGLIELIRLSSIKGIGGKPMMTGINRVIKLNSKKIEKILQERGTSDKVGKSLKTMLDISNRYDKVLKETEKNIEGIRETLDNVIRDRSC